MTESQRIMNNVKLIIGGHLEDNGVAFVQAWHRAERGDKTQDYALAFENWKAFVKAKSSSV